jgi:hypothetical protein
VVVTGLSNATALAAGPFHNCAVLASGGVRCWGRNNGGQLGNGDTQNRSVPDAVSGLTDAVSVTAGAGHTCAISANGQARCWGNNSDEQLGAADSANHLTPVPVIQTIRTISGNTVPFPITHVIGIAAGTRHTCTVQAQGIVRCWGDNSTGQLGDGTTTDRARPAIVQSFSANVKPDAVLAGGGLMAEITGLLQCDEGGDGLLYALLFQGPAFGTTAAYARCMGGMVEVPMGVPALAPWKFQPGPALARLQAIIWDAEGNIEHQLWEREVTLSPRPAGP